MDLFGNQFLNRIAELLATVLIGLICELIRQGVLFARTKIKNERLQAAAEELEVAIIDGVNFTEQRFVKSLKAEGNWDKLTQREVLDECSTYVYQALSKTAYKILDENADDLAKLVDKKIEARLGQLHKG
jgi:hypothetical protein